MFSLTSIKAKVELMTSPCCLSVCPVIYVSSNNQFWTNWKISMKIRSVVYHWRRTRHTTINPVASTITKWQTFKLLRWIQNLHQLTWDNEELRLVTMANTPLTCDSWTHTCVTMVLYLDPLSNHSIHAMINVTMEKGTYETSGFNGDYREGQLSVI
jgi:hypothetical protein